MDLLLTHGYLLSEDPREQRIMRPYPPLGILSLHAYLSSQGFSTAVLDPTFMSRQDVDGELAGSPASVVGIYCTLMTKGSVLRMIGHCRRSGKTVVLGGPEPAVYPEEYLRAGADVVVFGEGEETLRELLPILSRGASHDRERVAGIAYLDDAGAYRRTSPRPLLKDLDTLPWPDRSAIDLQRYLDVWREHHGASSVSVITARGCPYTCTWCSHGVYGYTHRRRSPQNVVDEIREIKKRFAPDMLWVADDVFTIHHGWLREFRDLMLGEGLQTPFECISRADRLSDEILDHLRDLRCTRIWIGSESGSDRVLAAMSRGVDTATIRTMTRAAQKRGIEVGLFVMLGFDGETKDDIEQTIEHLKETGADTFLTTVAYPLKGTPFHNDLAGRISRPGDWEETTDRDLHISGRYTDAFYWFALRRLTNEVQLSRKVRGGTAGSAEILALKGKSALARLGMHLTGFARS